MSIEEFVNYYANTQFQLVPFQPSLVGFHFSKAVSEFLNIVKLMPDHSIIEASTIINLCVQDFIPTTQHDCQEFLQFLFNKLENETIPNLVDKEMIRALYMDSVNVAWEKFCTYINPSFPNTIFGGLLLNTTICANCNRRDIPTDPFYDFSLSVNYLENDILNKAIDTVYALANFFRGDKLDDYKCETCNLTTCSQSLTIFKSPQYLNIQFKRFNFNAQTGAYSKNTKRLDILYERLDLSA